MSRQVSHLLLTAAGLLLAAVGLWAAFQAADGPPGWVMWRESSLEAGGEQPGLELQGRTLRAIEGEETLWRTEEGVQVQDFLFCDIDRDGGAELLLLCWKKGRYGDSRPFWVEEDEDSWSQHIFIYRWTGETMRPLWMASDIGREVVSWSFDETSRLTLTDRTGEVTAWDWVSWGLTNIPAGGE